MSLVVVLLLLGGPASPGDSLQSCEYVSEGPSFEVRAPTVVYALAWCNLHAMTRDGMEQAFACEERGRELRAQRRRLSKAFRHRRLSMLQCVSGVRFRTIDPTGSSELVVLGDDGDFSGVVLVAPGRNPLSLRGVMADRILLERIDSHLVR